ncbi:DinB family protein [bacterium]|nr:DinB family protein [bacterium]
MTSTELFSSRYHDIHKRALPMLIDSLNEEQLRERPADGLNPIAWMLWHIFRAEDVGVNRLATDGVEMFVQGKWAARLDVETRYAGTGLTADEVMELTAALNLQALRAYGQAVSDKTVDVVTSLQESDLKVVPANEHIKRVMCDEEVLPECAWSYLPLYYGKSRGWFLIHLGLTHSYYHIGQISLAKKLLLG